MVADKEEAGICTAPRSPHQCTKQDLENAPTYGVEETEEGRNTRTLEYSSRGF